MPQFSVANFGYSTAMVLRGQSFRPNSPGPNGSGTPRPFTGLLGVILGYPTASLSGRATVCYIYSVPLSEPSEIGRPLDLLAYSAGFMDGTEFGSSSFTRRFWFEEDLVDINATYYAYFDAPQTARADGGTVYPAGHLYDNACNVVPAMTAQFEVLMINAGGSSSSSSSSSDRFFG